MCRYNRNVLLLIVCILFVGVVVVVFVGKYNMNVSKEEHIREPKITSAINDLNEEIVANDSDDSHSNGNDDVDNYETIENSSDITAMITFIDDDGLKSAAESWERISEEAHIPVTMALITGKMGKVTGAGEHMSWDDVDRLSELGFEFISHTNNHVVITTLSDEELIADFEQTKLLLDEHGCNSDFLVFPQNASDERTINIVRDYFKGSFRGKNLINVPTIDSYQMTRVNLLNKQEEPLTLSAMKKWVDSAVEKQGWIVFMGHNYYEKFDEQAEKNIIELCKYARSKGVQIVNVSEGFEYYSSFE